MNLLTRIVECKGDPVFTLYPLGDVHIGTKHHDRNHWLRDIERVKNDPYGLWIGMGDYCECITLSDTKRFEASEIAKEFQDKLDTLAVAQQDRFIDDVWDVRDKCIGLIIGNHEQSNKQYHYVDVVMNACNKLSNPGDSDAPRSYKFVTDKDFKKSPYLSDTAMIRLVFRRVDEEGDRQRSHVVVIYAEHGNGGGRKTGGKINGIEDMGAGFDADIYLRGHVHTKAATKSPRLSMTMTGKPQLVSKTRVFGLTGCYYRTYNEDSSSYGQRKGYQPTELGGIAIRIRPQTGEMETVN